MLHNDQNPLSALKGLQAAIKSGFKVRQIEKIGNVYLEIDLDGARVTYANIRNYVANAQDD